MSPQNNPEQNRDLFSLDSEKNTDESRNKILSEIVEQARAVRRLQKVYFATRTKDALERAKAAERELDRMLATDLNSSSSLAGTEAVIFKTG
jgi:hypothetical protein